jgi:hypothetical protein
MPPVNSERVQQQNKAIVLGVYGVVLIASIVSGNGQHW